MNDSLSYRMIYSMEYQSEISLLYDTIQEYEQVNESMNQWIWKSCRWMILIINNYDWNGIAWQWWCYDWYIKWNEEWMDGSNG